MNWAEYQAEIRRDLAEMLEEELRPICNEGQIDGMEITLDPIWYVNHVLDRAIAIVKGER